MARCLLKDISTQLIFIVSELASNLNQISVYIYIHWKTGQVIKPYHLFITSSVFMFRFMKKYSKYSYNLYSNLILNKKSKDILNSLRVEYNVSQWSICCCIPTWGTCTLQLVESLTKARGPLADPDILCRILFILFGRVLSLQLSPPSTYKDRAVTSSLPGPTSHTLVVLLWTLFTAHRA